MYKICLVEDELKINNLITKYLKNEGYEVISCKSGQEAIAVTDEVDLWILDIMLGDDVTGYDIIKLIRAQNSIVPVIFTTARDQELDKIIGLELDADDYLTKPYSPKELMLRVNKIIKRVYRQDFDNVNYENYIVNTIKRSVAEGEIEINLTSLEFDLLLLFIKNKGRTFSREDILEKVWSSDYYGSDRVVDDLVRRLRVKMPSLNINTVYGYGYRLV